MILYGSIRKREFSDKYWYFHVPDLWVKDIDYVKEYPYLFLSNIKLPETDEKILDYFDLYSINLDFIEFDKVFDLRFPFWREKIISFINVFGREWKYGKPFRELESPLECLMSFGNYNILVRNGYSWSVMKHGPDSNGDFVEFWYYLGSEDPRKIYEIEKVLI
jgi:hypothetical protein